jgi:serine/threonine-protein kinase RsbW
MEAAPQSVFSSTLESRIESVEEAEESVHRFARAAEIAEADYYFIGLAVREIVMNAVKHGNKFDPRKKVGLHISINDGKLSIEITDQGEGFTLDDVPDPLLPENRERDSGRGVLIAKKIMDEFSVTRSRDGMQVWMAKRLS